MSEKKTSRKSWLELYSAYKNIPKFFLLIWQTNKYIIVGNVLMRLGRAVIPLVVLYVGKLLIDEILRLINNGGEGDLSYLWTLLAVEFGLTLLFDLFSRGNILLEGLMGDLFSNKISIALIEHSAKLDLSQFEDPNFYDKLERARQQSLSRVVLMTQVLAQLQNLVTIILLGGGLIYYSPWLLLILLIAVIPSFLGETHFNERSYSISRSWTPERRELDYLRYIGASDTTAKEVKIFGLSGFLANRFDRISHNYYLVNRKLAIQRTIWATVLLAIGIVAYYGAYAFIIVQTVGGLITLGDLTFLAGSFKKVQDNIRALLVRFSTIAQNALYLQDLFDFLALEPNIKSLPNAKPVPKKIQQGFTFENVGFKYLGSEKWVLRNISFQLEAGEKLALVGENGAGKTTLVKLLARLYEPSEGRILLDGIDIRDYNLEEYRDAIGIIFQDYVRFQMQANENIAIGQINEISNKTKIQTSAQKSLASKIIDRFENGYEQVLGKRFANGVELSGGEWQKIALARAYMRDAQLLILDEPTSALDARAEHEVFVRFSELIEGKSAVLISHRFSTVRMADRILFLEQGQLLELGSHDELIAQGGKYSELFHLQAKGYL